MIDAKIELIDTHAHIYDQKLMADETELVKRWRNEKVVKVLMPNVDLLSIEKMNFLANTYEECYAMMGLHPCSVDSDYKATISKIKNELFEGKYIGVGEIGIDLYWDKTYINEQIEVFRLQIEWAKELQLPIVIHSRDSLEYTIKIVEEMQDGNLRGIFHCFTGSREEAEKIIEIGFHLGIGGVYTYKNSDLKNCISKEMLESLVLETDSPYLAPVPKRGKLNEPSYLVYIAERLAESLGISYEELALVTTKNANNIFF